MRRVLLDTSAYSAFMKGHQEVKLALQQVEEIYLTPVILGELLAGFMKGKHRQKNETKLQRFLSSPRVNVLELHSMTR